MQTNKNKWQRIKTARVKKKSGRTSARHTCILYCKINACTARNLGWHWERDAVSCVANIVALHICDECRRKQTFSIYRSFHNESPHTHKKKIHCKLLTESKRYFKVKINCLVTVHRSAMSQQNIACNLMTGVKKRCWLSQHSPPQLSLPCDGSTSMKPYFHLRHNVLFLAGCRSHYPQITEKSKTICTWMRFRSSFISSYLNQLSGHQESSDETMEWEKLKPRSMHTIWSLLMQLLYLHSKNWTNSHSRK